MKDSVRIGIIADYSATNKYHIATANSIAHAARSLGIAAEPVWLGTEKLALEGAEQQLRSCDGLWGGTSSPYRSMSGALRGIQFARERGRPFIGT